MKDIITAQYLRGLLNSNYFTKDVRYEQFKDITSKASGLTISVGDYSVWVENSGEILAVRESVVRDEFRLHIRKVTRIFGEIGT